MGCLGCCTCGENLQCETCEHCLCCCRCSQTEHAHSASGSSVVTARPADLFSASNDGVINVPYTSRVVRFANIHDGYDTSSRDDAVEMSRVGHREGAEMRDSSDSSSLAPRRMTLMDRAREMDSIFDTGSDDNLPIGVDPKTYRASLNERSHQFVQRSFGKLEERVKKMREEVELRRKDYEEDEEMLRVARDIPILRAEITAQTGVQEYVHMRRATILALTAGGEARPDTLLESQSKLSSMEMSNPEKTEVSEGDGKG